TAGAPAVPVARGAGRPLIEAPRPASHVHGHDGMGDLGLPAPRRAPAGVDAVTLLHREILASPRPVTLVPIAPLTNIALLLRTHPEVTRNIERIVFMGGAAGAGNATPVAEFNVWHDPEAAAILLTAGVPITMYGLDVFNRVVVPAAEVHRLRASTEPGARLAGDLLAHLADMLDDEHVTAVQLRYLLARMNEALTDVCRIAESRGARLRVYTDVKAGTGLNGAPSPDDGPS
ncbi:nucleoside hydrolase, partial [Streptomyces prasinopilosus]|uniref:nucleoside hydrolase n=1 Tax=Streptomyces prasinopilosus TaxID=67344 RepID=UPI000B262589